MSFYKIDGILLSTGKGKPLHPHATNHYYTLITFTTMRVINTIDTIVSTIESIIKVISSAPDTIVAYFVRVTLLTLLELTVKYTLLTIYAMWMVIRLVGYTACIYANQWLNANPVLTVSPEQTTEVAIASTQDDPDLNDDALLATMERVTAPTVDYTAMTRNELRKVAQSIRLPRYSRMNKSELLTAIQAA